MTANNSNARKPSARAPRSKPPSAKEGARRRAQSASDTGQVPTPAQPFSPVLAGADEPVNAAETWRDRAMGEKLRLPSGAVCMARRVGMQALVQQGTIPNSLLPIVEKWTTAGRAGKEIKDEEVARDLFSSPEALGQLMNLMNAVTMAIVTKPQVLPVPLDKDGKEIPGHMRQLEDESSNELAYIDWIEDEDKAYLFNYATGGTRDVERFRKQREAVESLLPGQGVEVPS